MATNFAAPNVIAANVDIAAEQTRSSKNGVNGTHTIGNRDTDNFKPTDGAELLHTTQERYKQERDKRIRADGLSQYMDPARSAKHSRFAEDPWIDPQNPNYGVPLEDKSHHKILIVGAGFGGILYAVHFLKAGFKHSDLRIVDSAGGFGGTWYWNRYPGLMCDTESSIYLPLLEETGYIPKHRYSSGEEIRGYVNLLADKYELQKIASFRVRVTEMSWIDTSHHWSMSLIQNRALNESPRDLTITASFTCLANGVLNLPKLPDLPGIDTFTGASFHTARWDYEVTGGSPTDSRLTKLAGKHVAIIGTGATAIQAVPALAPYVEHLYVIQRTPSGVDRRDNAPIDPVEFKKNVASKPGWQRARQANFCAFLNKVAPPPAENLVNDAWTHFPSYSALLGTPATQFDGSMESLGAHMAEMHSLDLTRQTRIRARVDELVADAKTAELLKPWYPGWCKRPCFHDDYLSSFNTPKVSLIDSSHSPITSISPTALRTTAADIPIDTLIFSTGFNAAGMRTPAQRAGARIYGRHGLAMDDAWRLAPNTLHGVVAGGFPNMFFPGPLQAAGAVNFTYVLEQLALHAVAIIAAATQTAAPREALVVEPSPKGIEDWGNRMAAGAALFAAVVGCTPGYINGEGEVDRTGNASAEEQAERAKGGVWTAGLESFLEYLEGWRAAGGMDGIEVSKFKGAE